MLKIFFSIILVIHGLIHLLGFAKAFQIGNLSKLKSEISRSSGLFWLLAALLFSAAFVLWLVHNDYWSMLCLVGVGVSQILIIYSWQDAKFGTIPNIILALVAMPALSAMQFERIIVKEQKAFIETLSPGSEHPVTENDLATLPLVVQKWLHNSGVVGKPMAGCVRLRQKGTIKMKPASNGMDFTASQYINTLNPAFDWSARVNIMPDLFLTGRDKYKDGMGEMLVKVQSLVNVVDEENTPEINSSSALRYLAEMCWYPSAALSSYVTWQQTDSLHAGATLQMGDQKVQGMFTFGANGDVAAFEADRYFGTGKNAKKERWLITHTGYREFEGVRVPYKSNITWKLKDGDFSWLEIEITELVYNSPVLFANSNLK